MYFNLDGPSSVYAQFFRKWVEVDFQKIDFQKPDDIADRARLIIQRMFEERALWKMTYSGLTFSAFLLIKAENEDQSTLGPSLPELLKTNGNRVEKLMVHLVDRVFFDSSRYFNEEEVCTGCLVFGIRSFLESRSPPLRVAGNGGKQPVRRRMGQLDLKS